MNIKKLNEELQKYLSINEISDETIRKVARKRYLDAKINTELYDNTNKSPIFRDAAEKSEQLQIIKPAQTQSNIKT